MALKVLGIAGRLRTGSDNRALLSAAVEIYSDITPVPVQIAKSNLVLQLIGNENNPVWIDFPLDSTITLDTDETYYIGVTQEVLGSKGFDWYYNNSSLDVDSYIYGMHGLDKPIN